MAWQTECIRLVRNMIGDLSTCDPVYSDDRLQELLLTSAQLVLTDVSFTTTYTVDLDELILDPDPTIRDGSNGRNDSFINLMCIKSACILDRAEARVAVGKGIVVRDGGTMLDTRAGMEGRLALLKQGWCAVYEEVKLEYKLDSLDNAGTAILSPFRPDNYYREGGLAGFGDYRAFDGLLY